MLFNDRGISKTVDKLAESLQRLQDRLPKNEYEYGQAVEVDLWCDCKIVTIFGEPLKTGFLYMCSRHKEELFATRGGKKFYNEILVKREGEE